MGKIILLNTPIGNLGDVTKRVEEALNTGTLFAVEDTRVFRDLLNHLGIPLAGKKVMSLNDHSSEYEIEKFLDMAEREDLYLASDAGSPIISDPGFPIVVGAYARGLMVETLSGISSPIMALELSGLPPIPFHFHGFLPRESGKRTRIFRESVYGTHIFFEAPTRIEETLDELSNVLPNCQVAVVRELSKKFEQIMKFKAQDWKTRKWEMTIKGEFVFLFHNPEVSGGSSPELKELALDILANGASPKQVSKLLSLILDRPTKEIYTELNRQKKQSKQT